jgi:hypothetical protein
LANEECGLTVLSRIARGPACVGYEEDQKIARGAVSPTIGPG